ncbi:MAG TPA: hypothetical protein VGR38_00715, partial [Candidatus Polarisedimenticolia bacterium]|nr:hypothetical protein [Candidatus Polarisedimenticolia bacterium]
EARREPTGVDVRVGNPRDPERPAGRGEGVGLANVRGRLKVMHGEGARIDVSATPGHYEVQLFIPWTGEAAEAGAGGKVSDGGGF